jgi:ABC-type glycerol-3-phosphate transport system substrate-binding protein
MTLLIGCGKGRQGETKTINILMETVPDTDCVVKNLDKFTELTGIKVNVESINYSAMHEKLLTQLLSGKNTYDVIVVDCYWVGEFVQAGWLENLDPYIQKSGFDISQYVPSMMDMVGKVNGVTYMLPFYNYMLSLIYRTDVLNDPGLKAAYRQKFGKDMVIPDNMDDYVALCKFITAQKGEQMTGAVMMGLRPDPITMEWLNYLFSCGGDFYDSNGNIIINNNAAVHALELYVDNMNNAAPKGAAGFGFDEAFNVFAQGTAATDVTYNWMMQKLNNKDESLVAGLVEITPMPGGVSLNAGWGWGIPFNAPDKETSWKFLQWVESFDIAKARVLAGGSPTRADVMRDAGVLAMYPHLTTVQKIMETSKSIPVISDAPQLIEVLGRELSGAVTGTKSAKSALDVVAAEMAAMK